MTKQRWIDEAKENDLFSGGETSSDANKMLEHSPTNRYLSSRQAKKFTGARFMGIMLGCQCIGDLVDMFEQAQLCVDAQSRKDFMKVAIEQFQGKISAKKKNVLENLA